MTCQPPKNTTDAKKTTIANSQGLPFIYAFRSIELHDDSAAL
jgi:hypothetical protein